MKIHLTLSRCSQQAMKPGVFSTPVGADSSRAVSSMPKGMLCRVSPLHNHTSLVSIVSNLLKI